MKINRYIAAFIATFVIANMACAQVNKNVEITKKYIPQLEPAEKPILQATVADTVTIKPDINYSVTPHSIDTSLETKPITPSTVTYWEYNKPSDFYAKVGAGYPFRTILDLYGALHNSDQGYLLGYVNHDGRWADIANIYGTKQSATRSLNKFGAAAGLYLGEKSLDVDIDYTNNQYRYYATPEGADKAIFQGVGANLYFGDEFVDWSRFNFGASISTNNIWSNEIYGNRSLGLAAKTGYAINEDSRLITHISYDIIGGHEYLNNSFKLGALYSYKTEFWNAEIGVDYVYDMVSAYDSSDIQIGDNKHYLLPQAKVMYHNFAALKPFAQISSRLRRNNYGELIKQNPYLSTAKLDMSTNSAVYDIDCGIMGKLGGDHTLTYKLWAGNDIILNHLFWMLDMGTILANRYGYIVVDQQRIASISAAVDYRPTAGLLLGADAHVYKYAYNSLDGVANNRPNWESTLYAEYTNTKFRTGANVNLIGKRTWSYGDITQNIYDINIGTTADIDLYFEWLYTPSTTIFIEANNLLNADIYDWYGYKVYGTNVIVGAKVNF